MRYERIFNDEKNKDRCDDAGGSVDGKDDNDMQGRVREDRRAIRGTYSV